MLDAARTLHQSEGCFQLTEDCRFTRGETHVACQNKFAARAAYATFDLRDRHQAAFAQMAKQHRERRFAGERRCRLPVLTDTRHVNVGDEISGSPLLNTIT